MSQFSYRRISAAYLAAILSNFTATTETLSGDTEVGIASFYFKPQMTASGERFNPNDLTAAHRKLPFGTRVTVKSRRTNKQVVVRINDRGPFVKGRVVDVSRAAAAQLGLVDRGLDEVELTILLNRDRSSRSADSD